MVHSNRCRAVLSYVSAAADAFASQSFLVKMTGMTFFFTISECVGPDGSPKQVGHDARLVQSAQVCRAANS